MDGDAVVILGIALWLLVNGRLQQILGRITGQPGIAGVADPGTPATSGVGCVVQSPGVAAGPANYGTNPFGGIFNFPRPTPPIIAPVPVTPLTLDSAQNSVILQ